MHLGIFKEVLSHHSENMYHFLSSPRIIYQKKRLRLQSPQVSSSLEDGMVMVASPVWNSTLVPPSPPPAPSPHSPGLDLSRVAVSWVVSQSLPAAEGQQALALW